MRLLRIAGVAVVLLCGGSASSFAATSSANSQKILRFDRAIVVDATGFEQPIAALTLFIPYGWTTQGGVLWGNEYMCTNGYNISWSATSPDGSASIAIFPQQKWEMNNYGGGVSTPGCASAPYTNVQAYLQSVVQQWRPDARIVDFRRRSDLEKQFANVNTVTPTAMGEMRTWVESGETLFTFTDRGREMRGSAAASVVFSLMRTNAGAGVGVMDAMTAMANPGYAVTAPSSDFDLAFFEALRRTIKANPEWEQRIAGHNLAIGRVALEESRKRSAMIMRSNEEIAQIRNEAWAAAQESSDRRAREFGELIRGVETYKDQDAPGGTVELSHSYDNAWRMNDGSYVLSSDPNFEPWRDLGVEGRKLDVAP